jgi:ADP-ribosylglycohydrolase
MNERDRVLGALYGLAIGDALGMPTQMMSREGIAAQFGSITDFEPAARDHPIAAGMAAGRVTDDTEQALLLARLLVEGRGHIDPRRFANELVAWEDEMRVRGSLDLLGPSTKRAVQAVLDGEPIDQAGRSGTTNGAAMRVTPVGIVARPGPGLIDLVVEASFVSHNTGIALAGAAAVAAAVSAGIDGTAPLPAALDAAQQGALRGHWVAGADVAKRIVWARSLGSLDDIYELVGTSLATQESVPAAFGILALYAGDPWGAVCAAASLGGDSDTIAAMVGAIAGAMHGIDAFPARARAKIERVNHLGLGAVSDQLLALR